jgi:hypothetical protein
MAVSLPMTAVQTLKGVIAPLAIVGMGDGDQAAMVAVGGDNSLIVWQSFLARLPTDSPKGSRLSNVSGLLCGLRPDESRTRLEVRAESG